LRDSALEVPLTVEQELDKLEESIRRLKIEYESFFAGGSPRPPTDSVFRVEATIKTYNSTIGELNFGQRFRFNQLAQRYALYNDLWRRKLREHEEAGTTTPASRASLAESKGESGPFRVVCSDPENERDNVAALLEAYLLAKRKTGEGSGGLDLEAFASFVREKTRQIKESLGCEKVAFTVRVEAGKATLKAGAA
jgi:hypothetical protein